ncbi:hypothetical protein B4090_0505 [Bacillus licheniformis]|nr:hypothetical protein B4090_0505 [Bacillus licheniformis]TWK98178.1 hypothetical protein CHCC20323_1129 [Bacillus licheniformis]TWN50240.1 hypothetical protein CHCC14441_4484 [Bacillus licheniformis]
MEIKLKMLMIEYILQIKKEKFNRTGKFIHLGRKEGRKQSI